MRSSLGIIPLAALALCAVARPASAESAAPAAPHDGPCVDVQVGNERVPDFDCINRQFKALAEHAHTAAVPTAPVDAHSSGPATGAANQAAAQQMMGNAFGKSAQPQRPHPVYVPTLPTGTAH